jgi:hypothetical protein
VAYGDFRAHYFNCLRIIRKTFPAPDRLRTRFQKFAHVFRVTHAEMALRRRRSGSFRVPSSRKDQEATLGTTFMVSRLLNQVAANR